jgi:hypothetical protein
MDPVGISLVGQAVRQPIFSDCLAIAPPDARDPSESITKFET